MRKGVKRRFPKSFITPEYIKIDLECNNYIIT